MEVSMIRCCLFFYVHKDRHEKIYQLLEMEKK